MGSKKSKYFYPIPREKLIKRFEKPFEKLAAGQSATIVALPHTGRTSHLRFICSQPELLKKLGLDSQNTTTAFVNVDRITNSYKAFLFELINNLINQSGIPTDKNAIAALSCRDAYLLNNQLIGLIEKVSTKKKLVLIIALKKKALPYLKEIDNILVHCQKAAQKHPISILWNTDTEILRNYSAGHSSSTFLDNIFYHPSLDREETEHSLERIALSKGKNIPKKLLDRSHKLTGGFACMLHQFVNLIDLKNLQEFKDNLFSSDYVQKSLLDIKREIKINKNLLKFLTTEEGSDFIEKLDIAETEFSSIKLSKTPTAQEINLLELLQKNLQNPMSRDDIAKALWGKAWEKKYSDWAIDKAISRLRKNIKSPEYKLITVKNLGYELIKL